MTGSKKTYVRPTVEVLGSIAEKTQSGQLWPSDDGVTPDSAQPLNS